MQCPATIDTIAVLIIILKTALFLVVPLSAVGGGSVVGGLVGRLDGIVTTTTGEFDGRC